MHGWKAWFYGDWLQLDLLSDSTFTLSVRVKFLTVICKSIINLYFLHNIGSLISFFFPNKKCAD